MEQAASWTKLLKSTMRWLANAHTHSGVFLEWNPSQRIRSLEKEESRTLIRSTRKLLLRCDFGLEDTFNLRRPRHATRYNLLSLQSYDPSRKAPPLLTCPHFT